MKPSDKSQIEQEIIQGLLDRGFRPHEAIGLAANFAIESGFDSGINERSPTAPGSRGGFGLAQWTGKRRDNLESYAKERGVSPADRATQLDFLTEEFNGPERKAFNKLSQTADPLEATKVVSDSFLRPGIPNMRNRLEEANRLSGYLGEDGGLQRVSYNPSGEPSQPKQIRTYAVTLPSGNEYEIDAPDENIAWAWAYKADEERIAKEAKEKSSGVAGDILRGGKSGIASFLQLPSNLFGMATGDYDQLGGKALREYQQKMAAQQTDEYIRQQQEIEAAKKAATEQRGELGGFTEAVKQYLTHPRVLAGEAASSLPQMLGGIGIGKGAQMASSGLAGATAKQAALTGQRATIGSMAALQGGDIAQNTYQAVYDEAIQRGFSEEEAKTVAANEARAAGLKAGAISYGTMAALPGVEKMPFNKSTSSSALMGAVKGFGGEAAQEALEEGGGKWAQNVAMQAVAPETSPWAGVGSTMGTAGVLGGAFGAPFGAMHAAGNDRTINLTTLAQQREAAGRGVVPMTTEGAPQGLPPTDVAQAELAQEEAAKATTPEPPAPPAPPVPPNAITAEDIDATGVASKSSKRWLNKNIVGKTLDEVRAMVQANPTLLEGQGGRANVLNALLAQPGTEVPAFQEAPTVKPEAANVRVEPTLPEQEGSGAGVGVSGPASEAGLGTVATAQPNAPVGTGVVPAGPNAAPANVVEGNANPAVATAQTTEIPSAAETAKASVPPVQEKAQPEEPLSTGDVDYWRARFEPDIMQPERDVTPKGKKVLKRSEGSLLRETIAGFFEARTKEDYRNALEAIASAERAPAVSKKKTALTEPQQNRIRQIASDFLEYVNQFDPKSVMDARARATRVDTEVVAKEKLLSEKKKQEAEERQREEDAREAAEEAAALARLPVFRSLAMPTAANERSSIDAIRKAIADWFPGVKPNNVNVVQSFAELPHYLQAAAVHANGSATVAQGFVHNGKAYLIADNIKQGSEIAVFMHEVGAHVGLTKTEISSAAKAITAWSRATPNSVERRVYDAVQQRMSEAGEMSDMELVAYATEEAVKAGMKPRALQTTKTLKDVRTVQDLLDVLGRMFSDAVRGVLGKNAPRITAQNLVDLTYGAAQKAMATGTAAERSSKVQFSLSAQTMDILRQDRDARNAIPGMGHALRTAYTSKGISGSLAYAISDGVADLRTVLANKMAAVQDKLAEKYTNGVRDEFNNLNPYLKMISAESAGLLTNQFFRDGALKVNPQTGRFETTKGTVAPVDVPIAIKAWGESNGMDFNTAWDYASQIMQAVRIKEMQMAGVSSQEFYSHMAQPIVDRLYAEYKQDATLQKVSALMDEPRKALVDWMVSTGRITKAMGQDWKDVSGYVPFDRMQDFESRLRNPQRRLGKGIAQLGALPKIEGSKVRPVKNVFENYFNTMEWMLRTVVQQDATLSTLRQLEKQGYATYIGRNRDLVTAPNKTVKTYIDGQESFFELPTNADVAAFNDKTAPTIGLMRVFSQISHALRTAITVIPTFTMKQIPEDIQRAIMHSGIQNPAGVTARVMSNFASLSAAIATGKHHPIMERMGQKGIFGEIDFRLDNPGLSFLQDIGIVKRKFLGSSTLGSLLHKGEMIAQASDLALRQAIYDQTMVETKDEALALYRAQEIINFRHRGAGDRWGILNVMLQTVPFYNAYVQSMDVTLRSITGKNAVSGMKRTAALKMFYSKAMMLGAMSMLYALSHEDDDEYKQMDLRRRDAVWYLGKVDGQPMGIPVPNEIGMIFKAIPERMVEYYRRYGTPEEQSAMEAIKSWFMGAVDVYGGRTIPIPMAARPLFEIILNHSFFTGREIVGAHQRNVAPHAQQVESTSELAMSIAKYTYELTEGAVEVSPLHIDTVLQGYFGTSAAMVMAATNSMINPDRLDTPLHKMIGLGAFAYDPVGRRNVSEFYDTFSKVNQAKVTFDDLMKRDVDAAYDYMEANADKLAMHKFMASTLQELAKTRELINKMRSPDVAASMSKEDRQEVVDAAREYETKLTEYIYELKAQYNL